MNDDTAAISQISPATRRTILDIITETLDASENNAASYVMLAKVLRQARKSGRIECSNTQLDAILQQLIDNDILVKSRQTNALKLDMENISLMATFIEPEQSPPVVSLPQTVAIKSPSKEIAGKISVRVKQETSIESIHSLEDILGISIDPSLMNGYFLGKKQGPHFPAVDTISLAKEINTRIQEIDDTRYILCPIPGFFIEDGNIEIGIAFRVDFQNDQPDDLWNGFHANTYLLARDENDYWISQYDDGLIVYNGNLYDLTHISPCEMAMISIHRLLEDLATEMRNTKKFIDHRVYLQMFEKLPENHGGHQVKRSAINQYLDILISEIDHVVPSELKENSDHYWFIMTFLELLFGNDENSSIWIPEGFLKMIDPAKLVPISDVLYTHLLIGDVLTYSKISAIADAMAFSEYIGKMPENSELILRAYETLIDPSWITKLQYSKSVAEDFFTWARDYLSNDQIARAREIIEEYWNKSPFLPKGSLQR